MYAQKKQIENTHIVRERDRERSRELLAVVSLGLPLALFLLLFTWQNLEVIRLGREATRLQKARKSIEEQNKVLRLDVERLTSLQDAQREASRLGFRPTPSSEVVLVRIPPLPSAPSTAKVR